jgi:hypothetical protein
MKASEGRQRIKEKYHTLKDAVTDGIEKICDEMPGFMSAYGLTPPDLPAEDLDVNHFFDWLQACLAMLDTDNKLYGDLSVVVAARTLAASVCSLLPTEASSPQAITKTQMRSLQVSTFGWPSEEAVCPENLPALPKNIVKNFIEIFFKNTGAGLVKREGLHLNDQVCFCHHFPCALAIYFILLLIRVSAFVQLCLKAKTRARKILRGCGRTTLEPDPSHLVETKGAVNVNASGGKVVSQIFHISSCPNTRKRRQFELSGKPIPLLSI